MKHVSFTLEFNVPEKYIKFGGSIELQINTVAFLDSEEKDLIIYFNNFTFGKLSDVGRINLLPEILDDMQLAAKEHAGPLLMLYPLKK